MQRKSSEKNSEKPAKPLTFFAPVSGRYSRGVRKGEGRLCGWAACPHGL